MVGMGAWLWLEAWRSPGTGTDADGRSHGSSPLCALDAITRNLICSSTGFLAAQTRRAGKLGIPAEWNGVRPQGKHQVPRHVKVRAKKKGLEIIQTLVLVEPAST